MFGKWQRWLVLAMAVTCGLGLLAVGTSCSQVKPPPPDALVNAAAALPSDADLKLKLDEALDYTFHERRLNSKDHAAWQIVHGIMAYGPAYAIEHEGKDVPALKYLLEGGKIRGWNFQPGEKLDDTGRLGLRAILEQGTKTGQGHPDQWLGYLSYCNLSLSQTIKVDDHTYTLKDYLEQAMRDVSRITNGEFSWTIMALTQYYPTDLKWQAADGKEWTLDQLMQHEAEENIFTSACGGTHRLTAMAVARNHHLAKGGKLEGGWKAADDKIRECALRARQFQNPNGSFSSNYVERPGAVPAADLTLNTSGHVFEFMATALTKEELQEPYMKRAAANLCDLVRKTKGMQLECGGLYHAMHGLVVYRERCFGPRAYPAETTVAGAPAVAK